MNRRNFIKKVSICITFLLIPFKAHSFSNKKINLSPIEKLNSFVGALENKFYCKNDNKYAHHHKINLNEYADHVYNDFTCYTHAGIKKDGVLYDWFAISKHKAVDAFIRYVGNYVYNAYPLGSKLIWQTKPVIDSIPNKGYASYGRTVHMVWSRFSIEGA